MEISLASFRVMIPTRDSAKWVGIFLNAYRAMGVEPFYIVDTRSVDGTQELLRRMGADVLTFTPSEDFVEAGMIEFGARAASMPWTLRMDDDEFPTIALLRWCDRFVRKTRNQAAMISRRDLFFRDGKFFYTRAIGRCSHYLAPGIPTPLFRLLNRERLSFTHGVAHSDGIKLPRYFSVAPEDVFFSHFDRLLRTAEERLQKIRKYERVTNFCIFEIGDEYLPELFSLDHHRAEIIEDEEILSLLQRLPLTLDGELKSLLPRERSLIISGVAKLSENGLSTIMSSHDYKNMDADRHGLKSRLSLRSLKVLSELLCTLGRGRAKDFGCNYIITRNFFVLTRITLELPIASDRCSPPLRPWKALIKKVMKVKGLPA